VQNFSQKIHKKIPKNSQFFCTLLNENQFFNRFYYECIRKCGMVVSYSYIFEQLEVPLMRSEYEVIRAMDTYADMVRRLCMVNLKNYADTEDIFQNVFLKYALSDTAFESSEHEKAWFIRVTLNACKDLLKSFFRKTSVPLDTLLETPAVVDESKKEVLQAVLELPDKYRQIVYLYYYEGYAANEIAELLKMNVNTVYTHLTRAKKKLKEQLGGYDEE